MLVKTALCVAVVAYTSTAAVASPAQDPVTILGVDPELLHRYEPTYLKESGDLALFRCLDSTGSVIPYSAINDDFCDCADGSDEPGTSACSQVPGQKFWCKNEGHITSWIWSSRVGDGLCDPECCDGSDENFSNSGVVCPNTCAETGAKYREQKEAEGKLRKTGSKIRSTYISFAKNEKKRLEGQISELASQVEGKRDEVEAARIRLERLESSDKEVLEKRQKSPLYLSFLEHRQALNALRQQLARAREEHEELKRILKELSENYNPNYQDMAVKAAVVGYTEKYAKEEDTAPAEPETSEATKEEEITVEALDKLDKIDLVGMLMSGEDDKETNTDDDEDSLLYRLDQYVPDSLYDTYETVRDAVLTYLIKFGVIGKTATAVSSGIDTAHTIEARKAHSEASSALQALERDLEQSQQAVNKISNDFGPEGEWKKLEGTCIEKEQGEYTYSVCFFGQATQKSNRDGAKHNLGSFSRWNAAEHLKPDTEEYYSKQLYDHGLRCWNGPERSVKLDLSCGTTNELLQISEPEKCEYYFRATTPALCWPAANEKDGKSGKTVRAEL